MKQHTVRRTQKILAADLEEGQTIAAALLDDGDPFSVTLYLVQKVQLLRPEDETVTVTLRYDYDGQGDETNIRVVGIRRMDFVTVV